MSVLLIALAIAVMAGSILLIPLGLPGTWIMILVLSVAAWVGEVGAAVLLVLITIATLAELIEFWIVQRTSARYGGSNRAFWGAVAGGFAGVLVGMPVPLVGGLIMGVIGTFAGAALATLWETRALRSAGRVGWGAVVGRAWSAAFKVAAGVVILVSGTAALLVG